MSNFMEFLARPANFLGSGLALTALVVGNVLTLELWLILGLTGASYASGLLLGDSKPKSLHFEAENGKVSLETIQKNIAHLRESLQLNEKRLPEEITVKMNNIFLILEDILPKWDTFLSFSEEKYTINSVITDYLPQTIDNYLGLPQSYYKNSAKKQFAEAAENQLDILTNVLTEVRDSVYEGVEREIEIQTKFLKTKFTKSGLTLP